MIIRSQIHFIIIILLNNLFFVQTIKKYGYKINSKSDIVF